MRVNTTLYDLSMTLIIGAVANDGVVLAADSRVKSMDGQILPDIRKMFDIGAGVWFGAAGNDIPPGELNRLAKHMKRHLNLKLPYDMVEDVGKKFAQIVKEIYEEPSNEFWISFLLVGFGRSAKGKYINPCLITIDSRDEYQLGYNKEIIGNSHAAIGSTSNFIDIINAPHSVYVEKLATDLIGKISLISEKDDSVGGKISAVIMKSNGVQEIIQQTD